jgi:3,4-dihydroxy 2-butanone 4-phosphate synthase/GTP cyclohydrolase II
MNMESEYFTPIQLEAEAGLNTMFGNFTMRGYSRGDEESVVLVHGTIANKQNVLVRIQSSCLFGESFHATGCDCAWQVTTSLRRISQETCGIFIYLFQEGRGIGIFEKIRAYRVEQDYKIDTVQAFKRLGLEKSDLRTYDLAADIIKIEHIGSVRLLTNNESKLNTLIERGIPAQREPLEIEEADFKKLTAHMDESDIRQLINYLKVKRDHLGHKMVMDLAQKFLAELDSSKEKK